MPLEPISAQRTGPQTRDRSGHLAGLKAGPAPVEYMHSQHACLTGRQAHLRECRAALCLADPWRAPSWTVASSCPSFLQAGTLQTEQATPAVSCPHQFSVLSHNHSALPLLPGSTDGAAPWCDPSIAS